MVTSTVVEEVESELKSLGVKGGALAATALAMAREMDGHNSATSKSMCAKVLLETMTLLRAQAPAKPEEDEIERARKCRATRLAGKSASGTAASS